MDALSRGTTNAQELPEEDDSRAVVDNSERVDLSRSWDGKRVVDVHCSVWLNDSAELERDESVNSFANWLGIEKEMGPIP